MTPTSTIWQKDDLSKYTGKVKKKKRKEENRIETTLRVREIIYFKKSPGVDKGHCQVKDK